MVKNDPIVTAIRLLQLLAVGGVCFNHWSITLLKGTPQFFSEAAYREPALFGLVFLFFSSGFLTQYLFAGLQDETEGTTLRMDFTVGRYLYLVVPVIAAVLFDYWIQGFADHSQTRDVLRALPFLLTLTQTWHYSILGATSLAEPAGGSNMAWLSANLFFLAIFFGFTASFWNRIQSVKTLCLILGACTLLFTLYLLSLGYLTPKLNSWAAQHYGPSLHVDYTLVRWLFEYCPFVYITVFVSGILVERLNKYASPRVLRTIMAVSVIFSFFAPGNAAYLGICIASIIFLNRFIATYKFANSSHHILLNSESLLSRLGASAYDIYVLHLVIYLAFISNSIPAMNAENIFFLLGMIGSVNSLMLILCLGFSEVYFTCWHSRLTSLMGFKCIGEMRYV